MRGFRCSGAALLPIAMLVAVWASVETASSLDIEGVSLSGKGGLMSFSWTGETGRLYVVRSSTDLLSDWTNTYWVSGGGGIECYTNGLAGARFFRLTERPLPADDSDGDGLSDVEEQALGTDPQERDTDADLLSDGQEVRVFGTQPLNADSDLDILLDGEEVLSSLTDPLDYDSDGGGVGDGHEVLNDGTDPLRAADDLFLTTLHIEFDADSSVVKPEYHNDVDGVGSVLTSHPESTAVIEGHADWRQTSSASYNLKLSLARANAVLDYLVSTNGIASTRLTAVGYGFSRPIALNDPVTGNALNRRVEIYIRGVQ